MTLPRLSEVEQAYADRDAALERLGAVLAERDSLSALHEVATERTVQLAAIIEKASNAVLIHEHTPASLHMVQILASAPGDVLREHDAKVFARGWTAARTEPGIAAATHSAGFAALRVGAN